MSKRDASLCAPLVPNGLIIHLICNRLGEAAMQRLRRPARRFDRQVPLHCRPCRSTGQRPVWRFAWGSQRDALDRSTSRLPWPGVQRRAPMQAPTKTPTRSPLRPTRLYASLPRPLAFRNNWP